MMKDFSSADEKRDFIEQTLFDFRESRAGSAEIEALRALLLRDEEARRVYLRSNQLDCMLESSPMETAAMQHPEPTRLPTRGHLIAVGIGVGIAAAVMLLFVLFPFHEKQGIPFTAGDMQAPPPLATLHSEFNAQFHGSAAINTHDFQEGELILDQGLAQLCFRNGAEVVLEEKCHIELLGDKSVRMHYGKLRVYCPEEAQGFKVLTPYGREVVDLGTEFGISVTPNGDTDVHVFDGEVDVHDSTLAMRRITAGSAIRWGNSSGTPKLGLAAPEKFASSSTIAHTRIEAYQKVVRQRDDLLLYYNFQNIALNKAINLAKNPAKGSHGLIQGCLPVEGRAEGIQALQFENENDRISLDLDFPNNTTAMTVAIWVKIDRLRYNYASLINSDGWNPGDIHFQVGQSGYLKAGTFGGPRFHTPSGSVKFGDWHLLAVTWDFAAESAMFYCDGSPLTTLKLPADVTLDMPSTPNFGSCRVGSWMQLSKYPHSRELKGKVDEVMIFNRNLSPEEMMELFMGGRP